MPNVALLRHTALRALAWLVPSFVLWWLLLVPVLMPFMQHTAGWLLASSFEHVQARLEVQENGERHISTYILMEKQPDDPNKRHLLNLKVQANWHSMTLGLPLLWVLLLAIPHRRVRNVALGSAVLLVFLSLCAWFSLCLEILKVLADSQLHYVFITASISHRLEPIPSWLVVILSGGYSLLLYTVVVLLPTFLAYRLNRVWWQA